MDGYLNYKINLNTSRLMEVEEFTPTDVGTYNDLINLGQEWHTNNQEQVSSSVQLVDWVIDTYETLGLNDYLTVTSHQDNQIVETSSDDGFVFTSSLYGNNLLSGSFPLELTSANFNYIVDNSSLDIGLTGDINVNTLSDWSGFYSEMNMIAVTPEDADYYGNYSEVKITSLEDNSKFTISGNQLLSNGLIELAYNGYNSTPQNPVLQSRRVIDANTQLTDTATLGDIPYIYNFDYKSYEANSSVDGSEIIIPQIINNNIWTTFNNLNSHEITSPVNIEFHLPRTDYAFSLPFTLTNYNDLFDVRGLDFTVDMGDGNDTATVYEDHGIVNGGSGEDKVNFATINESSVSINLVNDQGIEYYEVTDQSLGLPRTIRLANVELVKFADQLDYVDVNAYLNTAPTSIILDNLSVIENISGVHIANISGVDPDSDELTYSIVEGIGNHTMFMIMNNMLHLKTDVEADYEDKQQLEVTLRATDNRGLYTEQFFTIDVLDDASDDPGNDQDTASFTALIDKWQPGDQTTSTWLDAPSMKLHRKDIEDEIGIDLSMKEGHPGHKHKEDMDKGSYELRVEHTQETDGAIDIDDVMGVLALSRGIKETSGKEHELAADWNGDGLIDIDDVMGVLARSRGIRKDDEWRFHDKDSDTSLWDNASKTNKMDIELDGDNEIELTAILRGDVNASYDAAIHNRAPEAAPTPNAAPLSLNNDDELLTIQLDVL